MKVTKGEAGYIEAQKKILGLKTVAAFGIVALIVLIGCLLHGDRLNELTVVAAVCCLPAARILVSLIMILPYHSVDPQIPADLEESASNLTVVYDVILTSREKAMPVDVLVIGGNTICGYTKSDKTDPAVTAEYLKKMLANNKFGKITVKIFQDYSALHARAEGMNNIAAVEGARHEKWEKKMKDTILNLSL